jgi:hypothetical protein
MEIDMYKVIRRIGHDIMRRRNLDAYAVAAIAFVFAMLALVGDILPERSSLAVLLAGVGLLVYRITLPDRQAGVADDLLNDRTSFEDQPFPGRLRTAHELWVFAPAGVNLFSPHHCDTLRTTLMNDPNGVVRAVVMDLAEEAAVQLAMRQLDDSLDYPLQIFRSSLEATIQQLRRMAGWDVKGSFEYRLIGYNPGFSLVAIDPGSRNGVVIVEFHAFHNEVTTARMHIELTRSDSEHWYAYWLDQFDHIWQEAIPATPGGSRIKPNVQ